MMEFLIKVNCKLKVIDADVQCYTTIQYSKNDHKNKNMFSSGFSGKEKFSLYFIADSMEEAEKIVKENPLLNKWISRHGATNYLSSSLIENC